MSTINGVSNSTTISNPSASKTSKPDMVSQDSFLKLLVAQIKHQDPLNPADGTQFLAQLAQFSGLEQLVGIRSELRAARETVPAAKTETIG